MTTDQITIRTHEARPLTKTFYAALGRIAVDFSTLENSVRSLLAKLMKSESGLVIAAGESMSNLLLMCQRVAAFDTALTDQQIVGLKELVDVITQLQKERNDALHTQWRATSRPQYFYGARSVRPNPKSSESLEAPVFWTVGKATSLAEDIRLTTQIVEQVADSLSTGHTFRHPWWSRRTEKKMEDFFNRVLSGRDPGDRRESAE
ncbi:MAG TPA: hypothetical protein VIL68_07065 [Propionibacteriaceae bacterium]